jgi:hypothetical protein
LPTIFFRRSTVRRCNACLINKHIVTLIQGPYSETCDNFRHSKLVQKSSVSKFVCRIDHNSAGGDDSTIPLHQGLFHDM